MSRHSAAALFIARSYETLVATSGVAFCAATARAHIRPSPRSRFRLGVEVERPVQGCRFFKAVTFVRACTSCLSEQIAILVVFIGAKTLGCSPALEASRRF